MVNLATWAPVLAEHRDRRSDIAVPERFGGENRDAEDVELIVRPQVVLRRRTVTPMRAYGRGILVLALCVAMASCSKGKSGGDTSATDETSATQLSDRAKEGASSAAAVDVSDRAAASAWVKERAERLDAFEKAAAGALVQGDCTVQATAVQRAVGDFKPWIDDARTAPDVVLGETLVATSLAARDTLSACANAPDQLSDQRGDLEVSLAAFKARRAVVTA